MADDKRITVTLTHPTSGRAIAVPLKRFTAENLESFVDRETDVAAGFADLRDEAEAVDAEELTKDEKREKMREFRRKGTRLRLVATWRMLQEAIDTKAKSIAEHVDGIMADAEDNEWLLAADWTEVERGLTAFRRLLGLTQESAR